MGNFGGPGIEGVGQADHADTEHDDRAASDAVGQHAEGPDQQKAHDLGDPGQPAADITGLIRVGDSQVLDENIGLGEVHVRHHPDADQGRVHVGPEVHYAHTRRQLDISYATAHALSSHSCRRHHSPPLGTGVSSPPRRFRLLTGPVFKLALAYCAGARTSLRLPWASRPGNRRPRRVFGAAGGKSGLRRTGRQVTPGGRKPTESATENTPPGAQAATGKGEMVR